jgi:hypothetical protein
MTWARMPALRIGRRGAILLILSVVDIAYGASLIGPSADSLGSAAVVWREHFAPLWVWGGVWLVVAAILIVSAFLRNDAIGYLTATVLKISWSLTSFASWMFGGVDRGWVSSIIWLVVAAMVWVIAGWPEPSPVMPTDEEPR